jgi:hypothetical protein
LQINHDGDGDMETLDIGDRMFEIDAVGGRDADSRFSRAVRLPLTAVLLIKGREHPPIATLTVSEASQIHFVFENDTTLAFVIDLTSKTHPSSVMDVEPPRNASHQFE